MCPYCGIFRAYAMPHCSLNALNISREFSGVPETGLSAPIFFAAMRQKSISASIPCAFRMAAFSRKVGNYSAFYRIVMRVFF
jgi:hypothetical protein